MLTEILEVLVPPVPVKSTVCGLWGAMSVKINEAVRVPSAVGLNVTLTVQVWLG